MEIDLSGKSAFVSGSTQGIGRAIAARLAECGAVTTINGRDAGRVAAVVDELRAEQPRAKFEGVGADVSTADGASALFEALPEVDILVNNLGIFGPVRLLEVPEQLWAR